MDILYGIDKLCGMDMLYEMNALNEINEAFDQLRYKYYYDKVLKELKFLFNKPVEFLFNYSIYHTKRQRDYVLENYEDTLKRFKKNNMNKFINLDFQRPISKLTGNTSCKKEELIEMLNQNRILVNKNSTKKQLIETLMKI